MRLKLSVANTNFILMIPQLFKYCSQLENSIYFITKNILTI